MEYQLKELFDLQMGKTPARKNPEYWKSKDHKWVAISDLSQCGKYISDTREYISDQAVKDTNIKLIPSNTVIMSFKLSIGKTAITSEPMYSNEAIMSFRDKHKVKLLPDYIYYMFKWKDWSVETNKAVMGATLNKATLSNIKIKVHEYSKQKEIVKILDKIQNIIESQKQELQKLDELIKARFVEMFGDLVQNDMNWNFDKLGNLCDVRDGTHDSPVYQTKGYPLLTSKNFTSGEVDFSDAKLISKSDFDKINKRSKVDEGDIIMPMIGTIGSPVIVNTSVPFAIKNVALIKFNDNSPLNIFIKGVLESDYFARKIQEKNRGNTQKFISLKDIRELRIPVVPYDKQKCFENFLCHVDKSKSEIQKSLDKTQLLFDSLMQKYFS
jgi:type I restriction enzyme S subunit